MTQKNPERKWSFPKGEVSMEDAVEEAQRVIRADYYGTVRGIASDIARAVKDGEIQDSEDLGRYLHESVDGSQRVIYTHKAKLGLLASDNEDAWEDVGVENPDDSTKMFYALSSDVLDDLTREFGIDPDDPAPGITPLKSRRKR
jgi:hypothetical protein